MTGDGLLPQSRDRWNSESALIPVGARARRLHVYTKSRRAKSGTSASFT
jgi:hypothetical protein